MAFDLDSLSGSFMVSFHATPVESPLSGAKAVFFEWISGTKAGAEWEAFSSSREAARGLLMMTTKGPMDAPLSRMRLFLTPAFVLDRRTPGNRAELVLWLEQHPEVQLIEEYRLDPGRKYFARVVEQPVTLPPEGPGKPAREARTRVLEVSESPFTDGSPGLPVPSTRS